MVLWLALTLIVIAGLTGANALSFLQPAKNRDPKLLHPEYLQRLTRWLTAARAAFPEHDFSIGEGRRTLARQRWLWGIGRTHTLKSRPVTWRIDSMHRWGLAADIVIVLKKRRGTAIWDTAFWQAVFKKVPPAHYGLETLVPDEWNHIQIADADGIVTRRKLSGMTQT